MINIIKKILLNNINIFKFFIYKILMIAIASFVVYFILQNSLLKYKNDKLSKEIIIIEQNLIDIKKNCKEQKQNLKKDLDFYIESLDYCISKSYIDITTDYNVSLKGDIDEYNKSKYYFISF